jgi:hypothetical protein
MIDEIPTPEEQAEYFRLQKALGGAQNAYEPLEDDPSPELAEARDEAEAELMAAAWRMEVFELEHIGKAFRVFYDEAITAAVEDDIEPLHELEDLKW